jgi:hypothetical protein
VLEFYTPKAVPISSIKGRGFGRLILDPIHGMILQKIGQKEREPKSSGQVKG